MDETTFLTKSGDLGMVLSVAGVDYESLDNDEQQYAVKRLESAFKAFGEGFHVYQYLFKTNRPEIPFDKYDDELIDAAIDQRRQFFESKRDRLYGIEIFYVIVLEGARSKTGILPALARILRDPQGGIRELKAQFTNDNMKVLLRTQIDADLVRLEQRVQNFTRQFADLMPVEVQGQQAQFSFFRRLFNLAQRMATAPSSYYTAFSNMAQQTWTPVAHPANTYGNSLPWVNAATTGNGAAAANQSASIQRTGQLSGYSSLSTQGQQAIAAQGATVDLGDAVNATSLQTIGTVRANAPQREADIKTLETASHSTDPTQQTELATLQRINQAMLLQLRTQQEASQMTQAQSLQQMVQQKQQQDALKMSMQAADGYEANYATHVSTDTTGLNKTFSY